MWLRSGYSAHVRALIETDSRRRPGQISEKCGSPPTPHPLLTDAIPPNNNDDKSICVTECPRRHKPQNLEGSFILRGGQWEPRGEKHNLLSKR